MPLPSLQPLPLAVALAGWPSTAAVAAATATATRTMPFISRLPQFVSVMERRQSARRAGNLIGECYGSASVKLKHRDGGDFAKWLRSVTTMGLHRKGLRATCNTRASSRRSGDD